MDQEEKKEKFKNWLKQPNSIFLILILVLALILRIYVFAVTSQQGAWWDEAEYLMKAKTIFSHTPTTGLSVVREPIIPYIWSVFFWLGNEGLVRFTQVIVSLFTVFMTYIVGKQLVNKKVGLFAALFMAIFPLNLFFTGRVLTYLWTPLIYLLVIFFFIQGKNNKKYFYLSAALLAIGIVAYFNTLFLAIALFIYLLFVKRSFFKDKRFWICLLVFFIVLAPFLIYNYSTIHMPLPRFLQFQQVGEAASTGNYLPFSQWFNYFKLFPDLLGNPASIGFPIIFLFIIGIFSFIELILGFDFLVKNKSQDLNKKLLLWLWILVPIVILSIIEIVQNSTVFYNAFLLPVLPAMALVAGIGISYLWPKKFGVLQIIAIALLIAAVFLLVPYSANMIKQSSHGYGSLKDAGLWIKQNSVPGDKILTQAVPEITYYSERESFVLPQNEANLSSVVKEVNPRYFVLSAFEARPQWSLDYPQRHPDRFIALKAFYTLPSDSGPTTIVFEVNMSAF